MRNPSNDTKKFTLTLDKLTGTFPVAKDMKKVLIYPYTAENDDQVYNYGDKITIELAPLEVVIMKFSSQEEIVPQLLYGRFESNNELLLFFDERIYTDISLVSSDEKIKDIEILEDYSTLKIIFENPVEKAFVSLTVKNAFGEMNGVEFDGKYYENFICDDNIIPSARDFSIQFTVEDVDDGELLSAQNLGVSVNDKLGVISFGERKSRGDIELQKGDLITVVCEPNGLAKLYVNGELSSSAYNEFLCNELKGSEIQLSENATNLTVISKALSFKEI